jgi:anti-sigma B factor antagonist
MSVTPSPPRITYRQVKTPSIWFVALTGEHDLSTSHKVEAILARAVASGDPVVVDLEYATFADSSILGAVINAEKRAGPRGFAVVRPRRGDVARQFQLVASRAMLLTFPTLRHAVQWFYPRFDAGPEDGRRSDERRRAPSARGVRR